MRYSVRGTGHDKVPYGILHPSVVDDQILFRPRSSDFHVVFHSYGFLNWRKIVTGKRGRVDVVTDKGADFR